MAENVSRCCTPKWNVEDAIQATQILKIPVHKIDKLKERNIHDPRVQELNLQLAAGNPYLASSDLAIEKFKLFFCERMGITLKKYFTEHSFE